MEYLYSDEGQLAWLKGYCHPIRFNDLSDGHDPGRPAGQAAGRDAARVPDPRAAGQGEGGHHQGLGHRRRRERQVGPSTLGTGVRNASVGLECRAAAGRAAAAPSARVPGGSVAGRLGLGVAPFFLFASCSSCCRHASSSSAASRMRAGTSPLQNIVDLSQAHGISRRSGSASRSAWPPPSRARSSASSSPTPSILGGLPRVPARPLMTFSGVASNFAGVPLAFAFIATLGRLGMVTVLPGRDLRLQHLPAPASTSQLLGPRAHLPVFPDPADGADHGAGHRRAEAGVARGRREPRRHHLAVLALRGAARCCGRACSARPCCCSPTPSARMRPPTRSPAARSTS